MNDDLREVAVDVLHVAHRRGQPVTLDGEVLTALVAVLDELRAQVATQEIAFQGQVAVESMLRIRLERAEDALAEADQRQIRTDEQIGDTRDGVMAAIEAAGLAPHVCDDDDLPDMVRHALTAAKRLAQPALWTYNDRGEAENSAGVA